MNSLNDPVKILARRFVSLPPQVRMKVAGTLLGWREADEEGRKINCRSERKKSFLEMFWTEVEAAHGDGLYPVNPFAKAGAGQMLYGLGNQLEQSLVHLSC